MATLAEVVRRQRQGGRGAIGALTSAIGQKTLEAIDPRRMLNQRGLLTSLFPSLKAFQARGASDRISRASTDLSSATAPMLQEMNMKLDQVSMKLDIVGDNTRLTAKNTMTLPSMARDMNVMRQNVIKLVKLQGGKASTRADSFFLRAFERERATESELQAARERRKIAGASAQAPTAEKKDGGIGMLGMLGGALGSLGIDSVLKKALSPLSTLTDLLGKGIKLILPGITDVIPSVLKSGVDTAMSLAAMSGRALFPLLRFLIPFAGPGALAGLIAWLAWKVFSDEDLTIPGVENGLFGQTTLTPEQQKIYAELQRQKLKSVKQIKEENPEMSQAAALNLHSETARALQREAVKISAGETTENSEAYFRALNQSDAETERLKRQSQASTTPTPAPAAPSTKPSPKKSVTSGEDGKLLDFIASKESNGDYNMVYGQGSNPELTNMTIAEVLEYQNQLIAKGQKSSAVGRYQFIRSSLAEEAKKAGIDIEKEKFTPEMQDKLILHRLRRIRGLDDFRSGKITPQQFAENLSKEFASLPSPIKGGGEKSYHEGTAGNKALTNMESVYAAISPTPSTSGSQVAAATSAVSDSQATQMQQPVVLNAPTTNVSQGQGGGQISGIMADTLDKELASLLVDRMVGA